MRKINLVFGSMLVTALISACSSGSSNTPSSGSLTQYNLQNYKLTVGAQTNNCTLEGNSTLNCDSNGTFGGVYNIKFNTPTGSPGAYVVMPPAGDTYGLNIAAIGDSCDQTAPEGGVSYDCNFTIGANGTAESGHTLYLQVNGSLGPANIVTINIESSAG